MHKRDFKALSKSTASWEAQATDKKTWRGALCKDIAAADRKKGQPAK